MKRGAGPAATLSAQELERVGELLYRRAGMIFGEKKRYYIERRIADRIARSGSASFPDWFALARGDPSELEALVNAFTVNETYFFREEHQLRCLERAILPEVAAGKQPGDRIRIWSIPCSSGEEPYSIAIWLLEHWRMVDAYNVEIVGSDINTEALAQARAGVYGERALTRLSDDVADRYFGQKRNGLRQIISDMQESVTFTPANLVDASTLVGQGSFDVIFCRNVLIYFDDASRARAVDNLHAALRPGGFVCLGHSESMNRISDRFDTRRFEEGVVYQKPGPT